MRSTIFLCDQCQAQANKDEARDNNWRELHLNLHLFDQKKVRPFWCHLCSGKCVADFLRAVAAQAETAEVVEGPESEFEVA